MMIDCNLTLSYNPTPDMATTEFKRLGSDYMFEDAEKILKMDGRFSPFIFRNNYRKSDNYIKNMSNCIVLDFDEGLTVEGFKKRSDFAYALGTTKSHNKDKHGLVSERFRVIIPTETAVSLSSAEFSDLMQEIFILFPEADTACKDTARAYSGFRGAEVFIKGGEYFDWEPLFEKAIKRREFKNWQRKQITKDAEIKYGEGDVKKAMETRFKNNYTSGNRNNTVANIILWAKDEQMPYHEIEELIINLINMSGDPLDDRELRQMFKHHLK